MEDAIKLIVDINKYRCPCQDRASKRETWFFYRDLHPFCARIVEEDVKSFGEKAIVEKSSLMTYHKEVVHVHIPIKGLVDIISDYHWPQYKPTKMTTVSEGKDIAYSWQIPVIAVAYEKTYMLCNLCNAEWMKESAVIPQCSQCWVGLEIDSGL